MQRKELTKMPERSRRLCICVVLCLITAWLAPLAWSQNEPFWSKHIPGNPNVIVQNMPGAGSITAVNYVYGVAKADGLTVVLPNNSIYIEQLIGRREAQFDLRKYHWLGSAAQESIMFYMRADTPYKSVGEIIRAKQPP